MRGDGRWIMDSGAFSRISTGKGHLSVARYADIISFHAGRIPCPGFAHMDCAVAQDYMCEPFVLEMTGATVREHQEATVGRYRDLLAAMDRRCCDAYIMPVLQGYTVKEYCRHVDDYSLPQGAWVGVGSVCKRNSSNTDEVRSILRAIKQKQPSWRLHGFGLKTSVLRCPSTRALLYSADSMAWSYGARINGRNANDYREALRWAATLSSRIG